MGLSRSRRDGSLIWAGFVDAVTTLLMVLLFVLTIFTVMQSMLRDTISTQSNQLSELNAQVAQLADALGLERTRADDLTTQVGVLQSSLIAATTEGDRQAGVIAGLTLDLATREDELAGAQGRIASFEAQVASLLAERDRQTGTIATMTASLADLKDAEARLISDKEALDLALARARDEISADQEAARLAAARRDALEAMIADMKKRVSAGETSLAAALASLNAAKAENAGLAATSAELAARLAGAETRASAAEAARLAEAQRLAAAVAGSAGLQATADELAARLAGAQTDLSAVEKARLAEAAAAEELRQRLAGISAELTDAEKSRLADVAAAEALREKLRTSDAELTAMTLALEAERKRAEATLTLLAAAEASVAAARTAGSDKAALLAEAERILTSKDDEILKAARDMALLNQQMRALRGQLGALQAILDASADKDRMTKVQIEALGSQLNSALAQVAAEQKRRADLEEAERIRLEAERIRLEAEKVRLSAENLDLSKYRSEFFGQISRLLAGQPGVKVVGDRFVFDSEVLFNPASADLAPEGQAQIRSVVAMLKQVVGQIPPGINWIIRVDGHTDNVPLSGSGEFADNWALSQGRALSVVKFMQDELGFAPERLAAAGFGEYQPVALGDTPEALAQNRRIELKLTER